ncbi:hypothetical protein INT45_009242 [Circinella minor]|uniref:Uncharacterized protein n=1 Tax=Circinella minor TaxID=1195481 RepID=A0A8H7SGM1_9FUNG|nr:hypothetical protein INT45_009242 [Circinella minor]
MLQRAVEQPTATGLDESNVVIQNEFLDQSPCANVQQSNVEIQNESESSSTILQATIETEERVISPPVEELMLLIQLMENSNKENIDSAIQLTPLPDDDDNIYDYEPISEENAKEEEQTSGVIQDYLLGLQKRFREQGTPKEYRDGHF